MQNSTSYRVFTETVTGDKARQLEKASTAYRTALRAAPRDVNCMQVLGLIECQLGRMAEAQQWFEKALHIAPANADIRCHYGLVLLQQEKFADAIAAFSAVTAAVPTHIEAYYRLAQALARIGQIDAAAETYRHLLTINPAHADALNNLGNILHNQNRFEAALDSYNRALTAKPDHIMALNNKGLTLTALGDFAAAETAYAQALALKPDYPQAHNNLGITFMLQDKYDAAIERYGRALALRPAYHEAHNNLANALKDQGALQEAIAHYRQAIALKDAADYRHNLSLALLAAGQFEEGWPAFETRWQTALLNRPQRFAQPQWLGEDAAGKTLLIHAEQGFGDTVQFCRYAPLIQARGLRVVIEVPPALARLTGTLAGVDHIVAQGQTLPAFDLQCPMLSLPLAFMTQRDTIPAVTPYLFADARETARWRAQMPETDDLRVGLVWAGGLRTHSQDLIATNRRRSMAAETLVPLLNIPGVQFYSLQKDAAAVPAGLIDWMQDCTDFADTAALVANLDLVISVDTAMVHLAGALGKPVWLLNRFNSCWRWFREGDDSPWYPSLRLFRQPRQGDWPRVIERVRQELSQLAQNRRAGL